MGTRVSWIKKVVIQSMVESHTIKGDDHAIKVGAHATKVKNATKRNGNAIRRFCG